MFLKMDLSFVYVLECKSLDPSSQQERPLYPLVSRMPQARQAFLPQCVFPFSFKNVTYTSCTTSHSANGWPWCATEVEESARTFIQ